eukprot:CAMPEP_0116578976 /NCGR_PEP_ID=MMETSP0397-20121206/22008_1 /TAXON_ID=216820 /ORGANISM="Cyclophora tenuis, Strain ECT3854" /LENGTH=176 /DNA_ID=CAMNT_0004108431 /DNA_START=442 /DNA_END=972 /DNA_ORIENTATION=+
MGSDEQSDIWTSVGWPCNHKQSRSARPSLMANLTPKLSSQGLTADCPIVPSLSVTSDGEKDGAAVGSGVTSGSMKLEGTCEGSSYCDGIDVSDIGAVTGMGANLTTMAPGLVGRGVGAGVGNKDGIEEGNVVGLLEGITVGLGVGVGVGGTLGERVVGAGLGGTEGEARRSRGGGF